jgi:hypothetical protein
MKKKRRDSLSKLVEAAFQRAAVRVIERAKQTGTPVIIWDEGRIKEVPYWSFEPAIMASARKKKQPRRRRTPRRG